MGKAGKIAVSLMIAGSVTAGSVYGAYRYASARKAPVKTALVEDIRYEYWGDEMNDLNYGEAVTRDTQIVPIDSTRKVKEVYVKEGDQVKIGDPVLSYDTELAELKQEMSEIELQRLKIELSITEKAAAKAGLDPADVKDAELIDLNSFEKVKRENANYRRRSGSW